MPGTRFPGIAATCVCNVLANVYKRVVGSLKRGGEGNDVEGLSARACSLHRLLTAHANGSGVLSFHDTCELSIEYHGVFTSKDLAELTRAGMIEPFNGGWYVHYPTPMERAGTGAHG